MEMIAALGSALAAVAAVAGVYYTVRTAREASIEMQKLVEFASKELKSITSASLMISLNDQWGSERMVYYRQMVARELLTCLENHSDAPKRLDEFHSQVFDFFENVGHLTKREILHEEMVWNLFVWELSCYYKIITGGVGPNFISAERERLKQRAVYSELEYLYNRFVEIDKKWNESETPSKIVQPEAKDLEEFLRGELKRS